MTREDLTATDGTEPGTGVARRTRRFIATGTVALVACAGLLAFGLARNVQTLGRATGARIAAHGAQLLTSVGPQLPKLTPWIVSVGLTARESSELAAAVRRGQRDGVLADLVVWDSTQRIVFPVGANADADDAPGPDPGVLRALAGRKTTDERPRERAPVTGQRGVLDTYLPLRTDGGAIYGAVEIGVPLAPIRAESTGIRNRVLLIVCGGALLVWALLLPFTARVARAFAAAWIPGRGRAMRACRRALAHDEIALVYQPQIDLCSGRVLGVEALVRWRHGGRLEPPACFLPAVEATRAMPLLTARVLSLALAQLSEWRRAGHALRMSVNLSATDLGDVALPERVGAELARHGLRGADLTLEVTETALFANAGRARAVVHRLAEMGIEIALDDFGTGHASLSRIYGLPIDELKIDRLFVGPDDVRTRAFLGAMIDLGHAVGLRVVAEGVEDERTLWLLRHLGCDVAQGYHLCRPLPAEQLETFLATTRSRSRVA